MKLRPGERLAACLVEMAMAHCSVCGYTAYRILVVRATNQSRRKVTLCGQHFTEACIAYPEIRELERHRLDHESKESAVRHGIRCPRCGADLDLGERGSYKIILATGVICSSCLVKLVIRHNIARPES